MAVRKRERLSRAGSGSAPAIEVVMRHWAVLRAIPRAPRKVSASALVDRLAGEGITIDLRSVQRDLNLLLRYFPLVCDDRSKPFGWSWARDAQVMDLPGMDGPTALAFHVAESYLERALPPSTARLLAPHFKRAAEVLTTQRGGKLAEWPAKIKIVPYGFSRQPPDVDPQVLDVVYLALLEDRQLDVDYRTRSRRTARRRRVNPLGLTYRDSIGYLACTLDGGVEPRQVVLHRMSNATLSDAARVVPAGFDFATFTARGAYHSTGRGGPRLIRLRAAFDRQAATTLYELPVAPGQRLRELDDRVLLDVRVADTLELRRWLRGFGSEVEILAPAPLRRQVAAEIRALAQIYGPAG